MHPRRARRPSRLSRKRLRIPHTPTRLTTSPPTSLLPRPKVPRHHQEPRRAAQRLLLGLTAPPHQSSCPLKDPLPPLLGLLNPLVTPPVPPSAPPPPPPRPPPLLSPLHIRQISPPHLRHLLGPLALSPRSGSQVLGSFWPWLVFLRVCSSSCQASSWHISGAGITEW